MSNCWVRFNSKSFFCVIIIFGLIFFPFYSAIPATMVSDDSSENDIIYLTGFGPFNNYSVNPSELVVNELNQTTIENYTVFGRILPVDFTSAPLVIQHDIEHFHPDLIISLGLDATCDALTIELVGTNLQFDRSVDKPWETLKRLHKNAPFFIPTRLKVKEMFIDLRMNDIPTSLGFSAGLYVCNAVFYETLFYLEGESLDTPMGFIHVPQLEDDNTSGMNLDSMIDGILTIIISNI